MTQDWRLLHDAAAHALRLYSPGEAERRAREALDAAAASGAPAEEVHQIRRLLIDILTAAQNHRGAREVATEWISGLERDPATQPLQMALALWRLAKVIAETDDVKVANAAFRRARKALEETGGAWEPEVAECLQDQAELLMQHDRIDDAIPLFRRALTVFETELGPDAREICDVLLNLGDCLAATGDYHGAKRYLWRGMVMSSYIFGSNHPATGDAVLTFGEFLLDHDDARDASPLLHRALAIYEEDEGLNGPGVAKCLRALAVLHARLNEPDLAFLRYRRALAIWESDPDSADLLPELYRTYADLADAAGRPDDAAAARKRATK